MTALDLLIDIVRIRRENDLNVSIEKRLNDERSESSDGIDTICPSLPVVKLFNFGITA